MKNKINIHTLTSMLIKRCLSIFGGSFKNETFYDHIRRSFCMKKIINAHKVKWEEALTYAQEEGENMMILDQMIFFNISIHEKKISVLFAPISNGGIYISAYDSNVKINTDCILCSSLK